MRCVMRNSSPTMYWLQHKHKQRRCEATFGKRQHVAGHKTMYWLRLTLKPTSTPPNRPTMYWLRSKSNKHLNILLIWCTLQAQTVKQMQFLPLLVHIASQQRHIFLLAGYQPLRKHFSDDFMLREFFIDANALTVAFRNYISGRQECFGVVGQFRQIYQSLQFLQAFVSHTARSSHCIVCAWIFNTHWTWKAKFSSYHRREQMRSDQ